MMKYDVWLSGINVISLAPQFICIIDKNTTKHFFAFKSYM